MHSVSVVIPTYDRDEHLKRAVKSVDDQTYDGIELIVVDDHSPTPASEVLNSMDVSTESLIVNRHDENRGANAARNTGISLASGDFIAFLDDDDLWYETKIEQQMKRIEDSEAGAVYTAIEQYRNDQFVSMKCPQISGSITRELLRRNFIGTFSTMLASTEAIEAAGLLDEMLPSWQDWDFYIRLSEVVPFAYVQEPLLEQHSHESNQISDDYFKKRNETAPLIIKKHQNRAKKYNIYNEFKATIDAELGWAAAGSEEFNKARRHFFKSTIAHPSKERIFMCFLTLGGKWTYNTARLLKQNLGDGLKIKNVQP